MTKFSANDISTCSHCGGIIRLRNPRCNRCGSYTNANPVENFLLRALVPDGLADYAATALLAISCVVTYVLVALVTRGDSVLATSGFSLLRFGATNGPFVMAGEYWRFLTANFLHHDLLHIAMNMYALLYVGKELEQRLQRHLVAFIFIAGGTVGMFASWVWYVYGPFGSHLFTSAGASAGVSALIGACWLTAKRITHEQDLASGMLRWSVLMLVFGFIVSGINNAAHIGGWIAGVSIVGIISHKPSFTRHARTAASIAVVSLILAAGAQIWGTWGVPTYLPNNATPASSFLTPSRKAPAWERSTNYAALRACEQSLTNVEGDEPEAVSRCKFAVYANPSNPFIWRNYSEALLLEDRASAQRVGNVAVFLYERMTQSFR